MTDIEHLKQLFELDYIKGGKRFLEEGVQSPAVADFLHALRTAAPHPLLEKPLPSLGARTTLIEGLPRLGKVTLALDTATTWVRSHPEGEVCYFCSSDSEAFFLEEYAERLSPQYSTGLCFLPVRGPCWPQEDSPQEFYKTLQSTFSDRPRLYVFDVFPEDAFLPPPEFESQTVFVVAHASARLRAGVEIHWFFRDDGGKPVLAKNQSGRASDRQAYEGPFRMPKFFVMPGPF